MATKNKRRTTRWRRIGRALWCAFKVSFVFMSSPKVKTHKKPSADYRTHVFKYRGRKWWHFSNLCLGQWERNSGFSPRTFPSLDCFLRSKLSQQVDWTWTNGEFVKHRMSQSDLVRAKSTASTPLVRSRSDLSPTEDGKNPSSRPGEAGSRPQTQQRRSCADC